MSEQERRTLDEHLASCVHCARVRCVACGLGTELERAWREARAAEGSDASGAPLAPEPPVPVAQLRGLVVLIAPWRYRTPQDAGNLSAAKRRCLAAGHVPLYLPDVLRDVLDDRWPSDRARALAASAALIDALAGEGREVWAVVVRAEPGPHTDGAGLTEGMRRDVSAAATAGITLVALDELDPPTAAEAIARWIERRRGPGVQDLVRAIRAGEWRE